MFCLSACVVRRVSLALVCTGLILCLKTHQCRSKPQNYVLFNVKSEIYEVGSRVNRLDKKYWLNDVAFSRAWCSLQNMITLFSVTDLICLIEE